MNYILEVKDEEVVGFLYSMLEVYWLSNSIKSLEMIKDLYGVDPVYIERENETFFLIKADLKSGIGYYIQDKSMESLIKDSLDEGIRLASVAAYFNDDDKIIDYALEKALHSIIYNFSKNPSLYKSIPMSISWRDPNEK